MMMFLMLIMSIAQGMGAAACSVLFNYGEERNTGSDLLDLVFRT